MEDLRTAKETGDEEKVKEAEEKVEKAEEKVEKAEEKVAKAEEKLDEKATQEKAIRCTASVLSQFSRKMQKIHESYFTYLHILWFKQFCFFSEYPPYASKR